MHNALAFPPEQKPWLITILTGNQFQFGLILLSFFALVIFGSSVFIYRPYDGLSINRLFGAEILFVHPGSPADKAGFLEGDQLLSVDGRSVDPWLQAPLYKAGQRAGDLVTYELQRSEEILTVTAALGSYRDNLIWIVPVTLTLVMAVLFWLVGLALALFAGLDNFPARLLAAGWLLAGAAGAAGGPGVFSHFWYARSFLEISWIALGFLLVSAHLYFPAPVFSTRVRKAVVYILAIATLILLAFASVEEFLLKPSLSSLETRGIQVSNLVYVFFFLSILASLLLLLFNRFKSPNPEIRRQTNIILWGTLLGFSPFITLTLLPMILFGPSVDYPDGSYTILFLILMPLAYIYVIFQRRLLKIDFLINRLVVFFILALLAWALSFIFAGAISQLFDLPGSLPLFASLVALVVFLGFSMMQEKVQEWVSRALYGNYYDHTSVTSLLSEKLAQTNDRQALTEILTKSLSQEMLIDQAYLLLQEGDKLVLQEDYHQPFAIPVDDPLCKILKKNSKPQRVQDLSIPLTGLEKERWNRFWWVKMYAPVLFEDELKGVLALGSRQTGDLYSDRDVRIVATVAQQAALAFANVQLIETLRDVAKQLVNSDEQHRTKVARDLHDTVLQDLFIIKQRLNGDAELKTHLDDVIYQLREIIDEQHPKWLQSGLALTLSGLVDDLQRLVGKEGPRIDFMTTLDENEIVLFPEEITVSIYRIVKEAVVNAWKHARSSRICVKLERDLENVLLLSIEDDGVGLPAAAGKNGQYGLTNMKERARMINARLTFASREGLGTIVSLEIKK